MKFKKLKRYVPFFIKKSSCWILLSSSPSKFMSWKSTSTLSRLQTFNFFSKVAILKKTFPSKTFWVGVKIQVREWLVEGIRIKVLFHLHFHWQQLPPFHKRLSIGPQVAQELSPQKLEKDTSNEDNLQPSETVGFGKWEVLWDPYSAHSSNSLDEIHIIPSTEWLQYNLFPYHFSLPNRKSLLKHHISLLSEFVDFVILLGYQMKKHSTICCSNLHRSPLVWKRKLLEVDMQQIMISPLVNNIHIYIPETRHK